jgi:hypothetical protein
MCRRTQAHLENVKDYNSPCASHVLIAHALKPAVKAWFVAADDPSCAEEAHDARTGFEGAKHDGAAAIFLDVGNGFDAGAGGIDVGAQVRGQDAE